MEGGSNEEHPLHSVPSKQLILQESRFNNTIAKNSLPSRNLIPQRYNTLHNTINSTSSARAGVPPGAAYATISDSYTDRLRGDVVRNGDPYELRL